MPLLYSCVQSPARGDGEDRVHTAEHNGRLIIAIADGAGGLAGGAAAAELVISMATSNPGHPHTAHDPRFWCALLLEADTALAATPAAGQAAAAVASIFNGSIIGAAAGDAVAWLISPAGDIEDLTAHTPRKPLLGSGAAIPRPFGPVPLGQSTLLLATDGLWKYAPRQTIAELALSAALPSPCTALVDAVRLRSGALQDDVAAALVRNHSAPAHK